MVTLVVEGDDLDLKLVAFLDEAFEGGGKKKGKKQIEDVANGHIVKDDIEYGLGISIPLWTFGLLY